MGHYNNPAQLLAAQTQRYMIAAPKAIHEVTYDLAVQATQDLREATSGPLTTKMLRAMGHPFAKRPRTKAQLASASRIAKGGVGMVSGRFKQVSARGRVAPNPINRQTGKLQSGIFVQRFGKAAWDVGSRADVAKYQFSPKGTRYMISRQVMGERMKHGFDGLLRKNHRVRVQAYVVAMRKTHRQP